MVEIRILGSVHLRATDGREVATLIRHSKRTALFAYLAAAAVPSSFHRRDTLLALFWPESDESHARAALNQALYVLRTALGENVILAHGDDEVGVNRAVVSCDASAFEAALDAGRVADAMALYRGDLLEGFFVTGAPQFERWVERERSRLRSRASEGAWALAESKAAAGDSLEAERWAHRAAELLSGDELAARRLMTFLSRLGDRAAAIRAFEVFRSRLAQEYELEPSAETLALAAAIREEEQHVIPERVAKATGVAGSGERSVSRRRWLPAVLGLVLMGVLGYALVAHRSPRPPRVLVLPFQNLGAPEDAYFTEGITDEITARLAMVSGLSVVGGQSAARYKGTTKTPRQMSQELDVDYVLEGTVTWQRARNGAGRVRVRSQLINARNEVQVWASVLDQDVNISELFAMLSGITQRVVDELHVALETPQRSGLAFVPTRSWEAYNSYLRGRAFVRAAWIASNTRSAIELLDRAVDQDSTFALAYAWLSTAHSNAHWLHSMGARHLALAKHAAERAVRIDPELPEAHMALGHYYYVCCQDYPRALSHLERSHAGRPGDARVVMFIGNVYKRWGRWDEGVRYYEMAARLDPVWHAPLLNLSQIHLWLRDYDNAQRTSSLVLSLEPREATAYTILGSIPLLRDGDVAAARRVFAEAAAVSDGYEGMRLPFYLELLDRRYTDARMRLGPKLGPLESGEEWLVNDHIRRAIVARLLGDSGGARASFDSARVELEGVMPEFVDSPQRQNWLGSALAISYAGLGRRDAAIEQARRVVASDPPAVDAMSGPAALQDIALTHVLLGDHAAALEIIERLLSIPGRLSPQVLRLDPLWDPLRGNPRFERLVRIGS